MTNEEICDLMEWHQRVAEAHMGDLLDKIRTVVEAEREACAKLCETRRPVSREECPAHWRAYESAWGLREQVANECAAAIRMRSNAGGKP